MQQDGRAVTEKINSDIQLSKAVLKEIITIDNILIKTVIGRET